MNVTFKEVADAVAKITREQPSKEQIEEAYKKTREALDKILNPTDKAKKAMEEMGIRQVQTLKIGNREITSSMVDVTRIRFEDHCGVKQYFATVVTSKPIINPETYTVESITNTTEVPISKEEYEKYEKELWR